MRGGGRGGRDNGMDGLNGGMDSGKEMVAWGGCWMDGNFWRGRLVLCVDLGMICFYEGGA